MRNNNSELNICLQCKERQHFLTNRRKFQNFGGVVAILISPIGGTADGNAPACQG